MTITYVLDNSLYINITNKCNNNCEFCLRNITDKVGDAPTLWLEKEPDEAEIWEDIQRRNLSDFNEIIFCGFGEPTMRIDVVAAISEKIKSASDIPIRLNTNGLANLLYKKDITPLLKNIDIVSISLNAKNKLEYDKICHSDYGLQAFDGMLEFARLCKKTVKKVKFTIVDTLPSEDIEECKKIAKENGIELRIRELIQ